MTKLTVNKEKLLKLLSLYDLILHGDDSYLGLFQCYDTYYAGSWNKPLKEINKLIKELKL